MTQKRDDNELYILTLEQEVAALRSVLAEYDSDHGQYVQWHKANALAALRDHLRRPA